MNQTFNISLAGFSFVIDEAAFAQLQQYNQALRATLSPNEADEVMYDIELRMAEILKINLGQREVVNQNDIKLIIAQIGSPEQLQEFDENPVPQASDTQKSLFRDVEGRMLGGVCAGMAHYLGIDKVWLRLAMVALIFASGFGLLLYPILWIVMPSARHQNDLLKMKGIALNFDNIKSQRSASDEQNPANFLAQGHPAANTSIKWLRNILGFGLILIAFLACIVVLMGVFWNDNSQGTLLDNLNFIMGDATEKYIIMLSSALLVATVIGMLLMLGIKCISPKVRFGYLKYIILGLFGLSLVSGAVATAKAVRYANPGNNSTHHQEIQLAPNLQEIIIEDLASQLPANFQSYWNDKYSDGKQVYQENTSNVEVIAEDNLKQPYLVLSKEVYGNVPADKIRVDLQIKDNRILLPQHIQYAYAYRNQVSGVSYSLHVPKGCKVINKSRNLHDAADDYGMIIEDEEGNPSSSQKINLNIDEDGIHGDINGKQVEINDQGVKYSKKQPQKRDTL